MVSKRRIVDLGNRVTVPRRQCSIGEPPLEGAYPLAQDRLLGVAKQALVHLAARHTGDDPNCAVQMNDRTSISHAWW
jgi:hypothetical protein